jgi:hypothetical protein
MDRSAIAYWLTWVGTGVWVICFYWMYRISSRQDALLTELQDLARTQHDILREVHPDVGEIKEQVVDKQGGRIEALAEQVAQVAEAVVSPEAGGGAASPSNTAYRRNWSRRPARYDRQALFGKRT